MANISKAYLAVTDRIIQIIEETNDLPWHSPWRRGRKMLVGRNHLSQKPYRGINAFTTALFTDIAGYDSNDWLTFKQAAMAGGKVRRGEKGIPIVFFSMLGGDSPEGSDERSRAIPFAKYSVVFNACQCEGINYTPLSATDEPEYQHDPIERAESLISGFRDKPRISHEVSNQAFYAPILDKINVPALSEFREPEQYYATLFHEFIHATGHKSRLARKSITEGHGYGSHGYSKEELIAELGSCFLSSEAGIVSQTLHSSAAYINHWLKVLRANPHWLVQSANAAQRALEFLMGTTPEPEERPDDTPEPFPDAWQHNAREYALQLAAQTPVAEVQPD